MKKIIFLSISSISVSLFLLVSMGNAHPANFTLTDGLGEEKAVFGFDETPWLEVGLKDKDERIAGWWRSHPGKTKSAIFENGLTGGETIRRPLSNWSWPGIQELGRYNVHLNGCGTRHITVIPEPVSSVLFLVGGLSLAVARYRKRRRS